MGRTVSYYSTNWTKYPNWKKKKLTFGISEDKPIVIKRFGFSSDTEEGFKGQRDRFYFTSDITVENIYSPKMKKKKSI